MAQPQVIVIGNEKGGAGKSTLAIHIVTGLLHAGRKVAIIDLDLRQRSMERFFANRAAWTKANGHDLPQPIVPDMGDGKALAKADEAEQLAKFETAYAEAQAAADVILIDTPGGDTALSRAAHGRADQIVTPMNDSFVDFDLIGQVDPETFQVTRPSFYSELIWDTRKTRAKTDGRTIDWIILRNRLQHVDAHNMRRVGEALTQLSRRVGFRVIPGLGERVIYRELFPAGLTLLDKAHLGGMGIGHVVARQELREAMAGLNLPERERLHPDGDLFAAA